MLDGVHASPAPDRRQMTPDATPEGGDPMVGRIARFDEIRKQGTALAFIDCVLPGHYRRNYAIIGDTAVENAELNPVIADPHRFQLGMFEAPPGCGPAWHTHDYVELFVPLTGRWRFSYGTGPDGVEQPLGEATLGPWDVISFPPALWRSFENVSDTNAMALAVLDPHERYGVVDPIWPEWLMSAAAERGATVDDHGRLVIAPGSEELEAEALAHIDGTVGAG